MPRNDEHPLARELDKARIIGRRTLMRIGQCVRRLKHGPCEALRSLDRPQRAPIDSCQHVVVAIYLLDRIDYGKARNNCGVSRVYGRSD